MLEKDTSHQMQMRFSVSEQERHKVMEELERTQLVNKDLVQSLSLFEVSFKSSLVGSAGEGRCCRPGLHILSGNARTPGNSRGVGEDAAH